MYLFTCIKPECFLLSFIHLFRHVSKMSEYFWDDRSPAKCSKYLARTVWNELFKTNCSELSFLQNHSHGLVILATHAVYIYYIHELTCFSFWKVLSYVWQNCQHHMHFQREVGWKAHIAGQPISYTKNTRN